MILRVFDWLIDYHWLSDFMTTAVYNQEVWLETSLEIGNRHSSLPPLLVAQKPDPRDSFGEQSQTSSSPACDGKRARCRRLTFYPMADCNGTLQPRAQSEITLIPLRLWLKGSKFSRGNWCIMNYPLEYSACNATEHFRWAEAGHKE